MHRIDHSTRAQDLFGEGKDGFTEGQPSPPIAATVVTADWANDVQESIANVIESAAISLDKGNGDQLRAAISLMTRELAMKNFTFDAGASGHTPNIHAIAGNGDGVIVMAGGGGRIQRSVDGGKTWSFVTADGGFVSNWNAIAWNGDRFLLVGDGGELQTSTNGVSWTQEAAPASYSGDYNAVVGVPGFGAGTFIAVGDGGAIHHRSALGSWSARTNPDASKDPITIAYGNGRYVIRTVGPSGFALVSTDGVTWTKHVPAAGGHPYRNGQLVYGRGRFVCLAEGGSATSLDGQTWVAWTEVAGGSLLADLDGHLIASDGVFFLGHFFDTYASRWQFAYSLDGSAWRLLATPAPTNALCLSYANGTWIGGLEGNEIVRSLCSE